MITKGERAELRSIIRQRFRVLRADVAQREVELAAELEGRLSERYASDDRDWAGVMHLLEEAAREGNRKANDIIRKHVGRERWPTERVLVYLKATVQQVRAAASDGTPGHVQLRREGTARIEATVKAAQLTLDRQEADLLTRLVTTALESDEARAFLAEIPTVSALVPSERLLQLEQSLRGDPS